MPKIIFVQIVLLVLLGSCSLLSTDDPAIRLTTDYQVYDLAESQPIIVQAKNTSGTPIHYSTCMATTLEQLENDQVVRTIAFPKCECICLAVLEPNEVWEYSVFTNTLQNENLQIGPNTVFRLRLEFFRDKEMRHPLQTHLLYTNVFRLMGAA